MPWWWIDQLSDARARPLWNDAMRERKRPGRASDLSGGVPAQVVPISERVNSPFLDPDDELVDPLRAAHDVETASRLAARIDDLETENLRLTQRGAADRAASDATWAVRLARELAEHETWYVRFTREHEATRARLLSESEQERAELVSGHERARAALIAEHETALAQVRHEIAGLHARIAGLHEENAAGARDSLTLREVLASRSWRATQPLRSFGRAVRRLFGGT